MNGDAHGFHRCGDCSDRSRRHPRHLPDEEAIQGDDELRLRGVHQEHASVHAHRALRHRRVHPGRSRHLQMIGFPFS